MVEHHDKLCPLVDVVCDACEETCKRFVLDSHQMYACPKMVIPCKYKKYGCPISCRRDEMEKHDQDTNHIPIICAMMDLRLTELDNLYLSQLQHGPFRVSGHGHVVILCNDLTNTSCKSCKKQIQPTKQGMHFGYQCSQGCDFSLCVTCLGKKRLYRSKRQNIPSD